MLAALGLSAAGHRVIDLAETVSRRVDAHPSAYMPPSPSADSLHFCMPGVPDYTLDIVLSLLVDWNSTKTFTLET